MKRHILAGLVSLVVVSWTASGAPLVWDADTGTTGAQDGGGTWDTVGANWWDGVAGGAWVNGTNSAVFGATNGAAGTVTLGEAVMAGSLTFTNTGSGDYTIDGTNILTLAGVANVINVVGGRSPTINAPVLTTNANSYKRGLGTLNLGGSYTAAGREVHFDGGIVNFNGTSFTVAKFLIGSAGGVPTASLNWNAGDGRVSGNYLGIGDNASGTLNMNGGSLTVNNNPNGLFIGNNVNSTGIFNMAGGTFTNVAGPMWIGASFSGTQDTQRTWGYLNISGGTFTVTGNRVQLTGNATSSVGHTAAVNLDGGTFNINGSPITNGLGSGTFNFNGGVLRVTANNANLLIVTRANVRNGGAVLDAAGGSATVAQALEHSNIGGDNAVDGGLIKRGANTITLTGNSGYNGQTRVHAGVLQIGGGGTNGFVGPGEVIISNAAQFVFRRTDAIVFSNKVTGIGTGGVLVQAPGTVTITGTNNVWGLTYPQNGTLEFDLGDGTFTGTGKFSMNGNTNATVNWKSGTGNLATGDFITFADNISGTSTLNVVGGTLNFYNTANRVLVGNQNAAIINVSGGTLNIGNGGSSKVPLIIGGDIQWDQSNARGFFNVSGTGVVNIAGGSTFTLGVNTNAGIKTNATGTLNLDGGTLQCARDIASSNGNSFVNFNGGRLVIATSSATFMTGLTRANIRDGGADITISGIATIGQALEHSDIGGDNAVDGGLTKNGAGTLTLTGTNLYNGPTRILAGTLALADDGKMPATALILVDSNTTLSVIGRVDGTLSTLAGQEVMGSGTILGTVSNSAAISPGSSAGLLTISGDCTLLSTSTLNIEIGGAGDPGTAYDQLAVGGAATLGGTLNVTFTNGYTGALNDGFAVLSSSSLSGEFTATNLPALAPGLAWSVQNIANLVVLTITGTAPPSGYDLYALQITNGLAGYQDDADGDGYANLLEYATGGDPTNADATARMNAVRTNAVLALRFTRATNAADATYIVEGANAATNDTAWAGIAVNSNGVWTSGTVSETGGPNPVTVTVQDTDPAATNRFLRLRVTRP